MTDVIIIGAGPAGLNAALYAARKELSVQVVSTDIGGQMLLTGEIENYLGLPHISGFELADKMEAHAKEYPVDFVFAGVLSTEKDSEGHFLVHLDDGKVLTGRTLIVTAGKRSRTLDIPGEMEYTGRGVSYCATCDESFLSEERHGSRRRGRQCGAGCDRAVTSGEQGLPRGPKPHPCFGDHCTSP